MNGLSLTFIKRVLPLKQLATLLILSAFAVTAGIRLYDISSKDVRIIDNGESIVVKTMGATVKEALDSIDIYLQPHDYISMPLNTTLNAEALNVINIKRAVPINVLVDGELREVWSYKDTVEEVIKENKIVLGNLDRYEGISATSEVVENMNIRIVRVDEEIITQELEIPFDVVERPNKSMSEGDNKTVVSGENGIKEEHYKIVYEDGKPIEKLYVSENIVKEPIDQVVDYGTVMNFRNSRGDVVRYAKVLDMNATAYTASFADTGKNPDHPAFGITYSGMRVREGIIAVDPKVIPIGTKVYVEVRGSTPDYGFAIAADIGSAIKGNLIDLYFDSAKQVSQWGRRKVVVYVLNEQSDGRWKSNDNPCR